MAEDIDPSPSPTFDPSPSHLGTPSNLNGLPDFNDFSVTAAAQNGTRGATDITTIRDATSEPSRPLVDAYGRPLNPRSCVTCRRRKVRCDKTQPCSNCRRAQIDCIFPSPGRAPRKARKLGEGRDKELLERLRRLEGVVQGLGVEVPTGQEEANEAQASEPVKGPNGAANGHADEASETIGPECTFGPRSTERVGGAARELSSKERLESRFGRLVINEGKSRYINSSFWANLSNEVEDLKGILNQSSDDDDPPSPSSNPHLLENHNGFVFGLNSQNVDMLSLHPLPANIPLFWQAYKENVDPLVKVLHIPTIEPTILSAASHLSNLSKGFEALLFAVYYGATTSMCPHDCLRDLGEEKSVLLARYRFAIEQSLARANFLTTEEVVVLQALVVFLICLRRNSDARVIWTLTGLVVRIAQTLGVHRDGFHFGLSPFVIEMRRRLWWQVCILDTRASEDHGCDPTIVEQAFDTKMPLNINDVDISPDSKAFPPERQGCTDMSFCLIRFEVANTFRRINYVPPGLSRNCQDRATAVTLRDKEKWITECHQRLEERYLKHCDMTVPLFWVTATVARLMMSKMWLMVYHPFQRQDGGASLSAETKEKLFITSLENIEYSLLLETETRTRRWGWLFKTYMQWHALAFLLSALCHRTKGDLVERAWVAVEKTRQGRWTDGPSDDLRASHLWRPLKKLHRKAKDARARGLQEEQLAASRAGVGGTPPARTYSPNANPMFGHPRRPQMVRAPLSQAQLQRFTQGPVYGRQPIDSHELLKSPRLADMIGSPAGAKATDNLSSSTAFDLDRRPNGSGMGGFPERGRFDAAATGRIAAPLASAPPGMGHFDFIRSTSQIDFSGIDLQSENRENIMSGSGRIPNNHNDNSQSLSRRTAVNPNAAPTNVPASSGSSPDAARVNSLDSGKLDSSMDTTGDLNWESWDQLVRQFGMDVDGGPAQESAGGGWAGPDWDGLGNQQGMRMGMGGGDWF